MFTGKVRVTNKVKKIPLSITYKNGAFLLANDDASIKSPYALDCVCKKCKCNGLAKDAFMNTVNGLLEALGTLDQKDLNSVFANGQNYYSVDVIVPPED